MTRQPAIRKSSQGLRRALPDFLTAPIGGWNTREPLDRMPATDAVALENWFPGPGMVKLRGGYASHATGFGGGLPKVLMAWNGTASSKLFAATATGIYDCTIPGATGAAAVSLTSSALSWANFSVVGGDYLVVVNGSDRLRLFNGTTWQSIDNGSTPNITGAPTMSLTSVAVAHRRLWFTQANSNSAWYLPVAQIAGALSEFPLGQVFTRGGQLIAIGTWSSNAGAGQDDYTVFASSEGELAVYRGSDPSSASGFSKVGVLSVAAPIGGHRCFAKFGGDLLYLCELGLFSVGKLLSYRIGGAEGLAMTDKINKAFAQAVQLYRENLNWQVLEYPREQALIVNIPITDQYSEQYVMNTLTGAWARFTGWPCTNFTLFQRQLYGGLHTGVGKMWEGVSDAGGVIRGKLQMAYNYFQLRGFLKHVKLFAPMVRTTSAIATRLGMDVDFSMHGVSSPASVNAPAGAVWDSALWDKAYWAGDLSVTGEWVSVPGPQGYAMSVLYQAETKMAEVELLGFKLLGERGGVL